MKEHSTGWEWGTSLNQGHQRRVPGGDEHEPHFISLLQVDWSGKRKAVAAQGSSMCKDTEVYGERGLFGKPYKFQGLCRELRLERKAR